jgi:hypothetical protein
MLAALRTMRGSRLVVALFVGAILSGCAAVHQLVSEKFPPTTLQEQTQLSLEVLSQSLKDLRGDVLVHVSATQLDSEELRTAIRSVPIESSDGNLRVKNCVVSVGHQRVSLQCAIDVQIHDPTSTISALVAGDVVPTARGNEISLRPVLRTVSVEHVKSDSWLYSRQLTADVFTALVGEFMDNVNGQVPPTVIPFSSIRLPEPIQAWTDWKFSGVTGMVATDSGLYLMTDLQSSVSRPEEESADSDPIRMFFKKAKRRGHDVNRSGLQIAQDLAPTSVQDTPAAIAARSESRKGLRKVLEAGGRVVGGAWLPSTQISPVLADVVNEWTRLKLEQSKMKGVTAQVDLVRFIEQAVELRAGIDFESQKHGVRARLDLSAQATVIPVGSDLKLLVYPTQLRLAHLELSNLGRANEEFVQTSFHSIAAVLLQEGQLDLPSQLIPLNIFPLQVELPKAESGVETYPGAILIDSLAPTQVAVRLDQSGMKAVVLEPAAGTPIEPQAEEIGTQHTTTNSADIDELMSRVNGDVLALSGNQIETEISLSWLFSKVTDAALAANLQVVASFQGSSESPAERISGPKPKLDCRQFRHSRSRCPLEKCSRRSCSRNCEWWNVDCKRLEARRGLCNLRANRAKAACDAAEEARVGAGNLLAETCVTAENALNEVRDIGNIAIREKHRFVGEISEPRFSYHSEGQTLELEMKVAGVAELEGGAEFTPMDVGHVLACPSSTTIQLNARMSLSDASARVEVPLSSRRLGNGSTQLEAGPFTVELTGQLSPSPLEALLSSNPDLVIRCPLVGVTGKALAAVPSLVLGQDAQEWHSGRVNRTVKIPKMEVRIPASSFSVGSTRVELTPVLRRRTIALTATSR